MAYGGVETPPFHRRIFFYVSLGSRQGVARFADVA
jgi:hypothetical protein